MDQDKQMVERLNEARVALGRYQSEVLKSLGPSKDGSFTDVCQALHQVVMEGGIHVPRHWLLRLEGVFQDGSSLQMSLVVEEHPFSFIAQLHDHLREMKQKHLAPLESPNSAMSKVHSIVVFMPVSFQELTEADMVEALAANITVGDAEGVVETFALYYHTFSKKN